MNNKKNFTCPHATACILSQDGKLLSNLAVYNHWTGLVDWTGGLDWWTGLVDWTGGLTLKIISTLSNDTHLPVGLHGA